MQARQRVIVTPAGRKRYMRLLIGYLEMQRKEFDIYRIWVNTAVPEDLEFIEALPKKYNWIELDDRRKAPGEVPGIYKHFDKCTDENTVYLRLDDDIVFLERDFIKENFKAREENPQYFLTYGNIVNNAIIDFIHQHLGANHISVPIEYQCCGLAGWKTPEFAIEKHASFFENYNSNTLHKYRFPRWQITNFEQVSINAISWFGKDFQKFGGIVDQDEEHWLCCVKAKQLGRPSCIFGGPVCAHFSFFPTREALDKTPILDAYEKVLDHVGGTPGDA
jgi:hypothetical protein